MSWDSKFSSQLGLLPFFYYGMQIMNEDICTQFVKASWPS